MKHTLKLYSEFYEDVENGTKSFEVRKGRFFVGDILELSEVKKYQSDYIETGRKLKAIVTYVLSGGRFGLSKKINVFGIKVVGREMMLSVNNRRP